MYVTLTNQEDRTMRNGAVKLLVKMNMFSSWPTERLDRLASKLHRRVYIQKQLIIDQVNNIHNINELISLYKHIYIGRNIELYLFCGNWFSVVNTSG